MAIFCILRWHQVGQVNCGLKDLLHHCVNLVTFWNLDSRDGKLRAKSQTQDAARVPDFVKRDFLRVNPIVFFVCWAMVNRLNQPDCILMLVLEYQFEQSCVSFQKNSLIFMLIYNCLDLVVVWLTHLDVRRVSVSLAILLLKFLPKPLLNIEVVRLFTLAINNFEEHFMQHHSFAEVKFILTKEEGVRAAVLKIGFV